MRTYQRKFLDDGSINPAWKPRAKETHRSGKSIRKTLEDGSINPRYQTRKRVHVKRKPAPYKSRSQFKTGDFLAFDGEGITTGSGANERHRYVMLCCSNGAHIVNLHGLSTLDCLDFLCTQRESYSRTAICVVFAGGYDVNMMIGDLTNHEVTALWQGEWVEVRGRFRIQYRQRKSFHVQRIDRTRVRQPKPTVLWDVFGFFQSSFVTAMTKYFGDDYPDLRFIAEQKAIRSEFDASEVATILRYCLRECAMLVALMDRVREHLQTCDLAISRWDGAGACAASLLRRENIKEHMSKGMPDLVLDAAQFAYAGGRMEVFQFGHSPNTTIHHYDINSAYPAAMLHCPSLAFGAWYHHARYTDDSLIEAPFALFHVRFKWDKRTRICPLFWRSCDGAIYFPHGEGQGWYWSPEVQITARMLSMGKLRGRMDILEVLEYRAARNVTPPFAFLPALFEQRKQWKRDGIGAEKMLKLAINSLYGKTAQRVGGRNGQPTFHELPWAGYITSRTRATIYAACMHAPNDIIMTATDGVYSLSPLPLPCSNELGEWDYKTHTGLTVVQSGVYWTDNAQQDEDGDDTHLYCRGFDADSLNRSKIVRAWRQGKASYPAKLTRFCTMGSALAGPKQWKFWRQWRTVTHDLALYPNGGKRYAPEDAKPHEGFVRTMPSVPIDIFAGYPHSMAHRLPWRDMPEACTYPVEKIDGVDADIVADECEDSIL